MEQVNKLIGYATAHPTVAIVAGLAVVIVLYLLMRKPKTVREAEARMRKLRDEKAGQYNDPRPLH